MSTTIFLFTGILLAENTREIILPSMDPAHVIKLLKPLLPVNPVILEAGAYDGSDSLLLSRTWPAGTLYSFEPVPELFNQLENKAKRTTNIKCFQLALSNKDGFTEFILSEHIGAPGLVSQSSSLLAPKEHLTYDHSVTFNKKIQVNAVTLDTWARENNITKVDFLWLDLQGIELDVMKSSPFVMSGVKVVYIEVEFVEAYAKQALFGDVDNWLKAQGFRRIARDFKLPLPKKCWFGNCVYIR